MSTNVDADKERVKELSTHQKRFRGKNSRNKEQQAIQLPYRIHHGNRPALDIPFVQIYSFGNSEHAVVIL